VKIGVIDEQTPKAGEIQGGEINKIEVLNEIQEVISDC